MNRSISGNGSPEPNWWLWQIALFTFLLAALTGVAYRFGITGWLPGDFNLQNIRHAHSHLMFFGWAVPLPFLILLHQAGKCTEAGAKGMQVMRRSLGAGLFFGLLTWPFFLFHGYESVHAGPISLPLSVILSGVVMITWYGFMAGYLMVRRNLKREASTSWYDISLLMLFVSSFGAWGVSVLQMMDVQNQLFAKAMTHFFLSSFTEGWVVLAVLAIFIQVLRVKERDLLISSGYLTGLIAIGAPLTFPYGISESLLTPLLLNTARIGGLMVSAGVILTLYTLIRKAGFRSVWIWPAGFMMLKAVMQSGSSVIPMEFWLSDHALRMLYLHLLLLGALTLSGIVWLNKLDQNVSDVYTHLVSASVSAVLLSLLMISGLWPAPWRGTPVYQFTAVAALLPAVAILINWLKLNSKRCLPKISD